MKKQSLLLVFVLWVITLTAQQTVTLKFKASAQNGDYIQLSKVNVTNVTRGWTESLIYPDTTMVLTSYDGLNENYGSVGFMSEAYPNPSQGKTNVLLNVDKAGKVTAKAMSINGEVLAECTGFVNGGLHQLIIDLDRPQLALIVVSTSNSQFSKKIINVGCGECNKIDMIQINCADNHHSREIYSSGEFVIGDVMSYSAELIVNGNSIYSNTITQAQYNNETIVLTFSLTKPTVITDDVANITGNSAISGGNVTSSGVGGNVFAKGVCWSTNQNPTINNDYTIDGTGTGTFVSHIVDLTPNTTYYVRAYATNEAGTSYGSQKTFITMTLPTVTTNEITNITPLSAISGGNVTSSGNGDIMARGVCWSTNQNPTISDQYTIDGTGTGSYTSSITGLNIGTTYYVRAYATNLAGTNYGEQKSFTTSVVPTGAITGVFSVSANTHIYFSQGNLMYQASSNNWRFADHQWDYVGSEVVSQGQSGGTINGSSNHLVSPTYNGWIDLFGFGTSGFNHGAVCYQPWSVSCNNSDYYAYGSSMLNLYDNNGQADWGYNAISNGGYNTGSWRTLSNNEWEYVLNTRNTTSGIRYAKARVNNINGVIILPDNWSSNTYNLNNTNSNEAHFDSNVITASDWNMLENAGAVFIPAAGRRVYSDIFEEMSICDVGDAGQYWSSTSSGDANAFILSFGNNNIHVIGTYPRCWGPSVRLVRNVE